MKKPRFGEAVPGASPASRGRARRVEGIDAMAAGRGDGGGVVRRPAVPLWKRGLVVERELDLVAEKPLEEPVAALVRGRAVHRGQATAVGSADLYALVRVEGYRPAALVYEAVMEGAQGHEVVLLGGAAVGPVLHVVAVDEAVVLAPRERAASSAEGAVAEHDGAAHGGRDLARLAATSRGSPRSSSLTTRSEQSQASRRNVSAETREPSSSCAVQAAAAGSGSRDSGSRGSGASASGSRGSGASAS